MKNSERATGVAGVTPNGDLDASTRRRVLSSILEHGPSTAAELSGRLGLTPAGIRRHLDVLLAYGHVEAREQRIYGARGRGRPAKDFVLHLRTVRARLRHALFEPHPRIRAHWCCEKL